MGTIYRAIMPFLLLLSCAFAQYDFSDVRFRKSVDMRRAAWMTLPTLAADPSGGCLFEDQVVKSAPTSTLWTCRNATWVQLSGSGSGAVTGDTGTVTVNPANGKVDADITEIMARPLAPTSSFDASNATRTSPFKIVSTAPTVGAGCPGLAGTFQMHGTTGTRYRCNSSEVWSLDGAAAKYSTSTQVVSCVDGAGYAQVVIARGVSNNGCRVVGDMEYGYNTILTANTSATLLWWTHMPITSTTLTASIWGINSNTITTGTVSGRFRVACASSGGAGAMLFGGWVGTNTPTATTGVNDRVFKFSATITHGCSAGQLMAIQFSRTNPGGSSDNWMQYFQMGMEAE
jgi:hypothetical protein